MSHSRGRVSELRCSATLVGDQAKCFVRHSNRGRFLLCSRSLRNGSIPAELRRPAPQLQVPLVARPRNHPTCGERSPVSGCCFSSPKTLLMPTTETAFCGRVNVSTVLVNCRFWVSTEVRTG